jgi:hypothetical protein
MIDRTLDRPAAAYLPTARPDPSKTGLAQISDLKQLIEPVEKLILQYPAVALASAFLVGVALACWIKRK